MMDARKNREIHPNADPIPHAPRLIMRLKKKALYMIPAHGWVLCRLWYMEPMPPDSGRPGVYAVSMEGLGYRRLVCLRYSHPSPEEVFALLVRNTVTPCALLDVLEELTEP